MWNYLPRFLLHRNILPSRAGIGYNQCEFAIAFSFSSGEVRFREFREKSMWLSGIWASGLIGLIYIERRSTRGEEDDHQEEEEVAGRVPEEGVEPVQSGLGESPVEQTLFYFRQISKRHGGFRGHRLTIVPCLVWERFSVGRRKWKVPGSPRRFNGLILSRSRINVTSKRPLMRTLPLAHEKLQTLATNYWCSVQLCLAANFLVTRVSLFQPIF